MNVASMLSSGYLQPATPVKPAEVVNAQPSSSLARQEQQILAQERALAAGGGSVSTTYRYTVGPDGRRYITGAEVTITGDEGIIDGISGGVKHEELRPVVKAVSEGAGRGESTTQSVGAGKSEAADAQIAAAQSANSQVVNKLEQTEREVVAHEAAHKAAGGRFAGAASYTYTQGPDGRSYITGGEVPINVPASDDPEETLRNMEQVVRAALAPGSPSGQDLSVAASAAAAAAQARQQIARQNGQDAADSRDASSEDALKTGAASIQADIRFERIRSGDEADTENTNPVEPEEIRDAYARTASKHGMWALGRGFEPETADDETNRLDVAA
ncbi:MAG: hypothetical protein LBT65_07115 [Synergistaceae bacterium]|jgi:hypothetical protein|nr:hypothetical protein [Synergistaceae bacterium]